jgi:hypothetical protein
MKKNFWSIVVWVAFLSIGWTVACAQAYVWVPITTFDETWQTFSEGTGTGTVVTEGAKINLSANGLDTGYFLGGLSKTDSTGVSGILTTLRIDQITGNCNIGLKASLGQVGNNKIQMRIYLVQYNKTKSIQFRVESIDLNTNLSKTVSQGTFGEWDGSWVPGDSKAIAFAKIESELWFYVDGYPQILKLQMLDEMTAYKGSLEAYVYAGPGAENSVSGSVSGIYYLYP